MQRISANVRIMASKERTKPAGFPVTLTPTARQYVETIRERTGIPNTEAMARILEWFASMPAAFQTAVLLKQGDERDVQLLDWVQRYLAAKDVDITQLAAAEPKDLFDKVRKILTEAEHQLIRYKSATRELTDIVKKKGK